MRKNEQGYALLIAMMAVLIVTILGMGIITVSSNSLKTSTTERSTHSNFYFAESGLNYYETILLDELNKIFTEAKSKVKDTDPQSDSKFNSEFDTKLKNLLTSINNKQVDAAKFSSTLNGTPTVIVNVTYKDGTGINPREFTLLSSAFTTVQPSLKKVERTYTIPADLISKVTYEEVVEINTPPTPEPVITVDQSFRNKTANFYITDYLSIQQPKTNLNAKYFVDFRESQILKYAFLWGHGKSLKSITEFNYNWKNVKYPVKAASYKTVSYNTNNLKTLSLDGKEVTLTGNYKVGKLKNLGNHTFNLKSSNANTSTIVFEESWYLYNLNSLKFNVSGTGTLNILFNKDFRISAGHKFIINAPNATVNLIFKDDTKILGELVAQDIYILKKDSKLFSIINNDFKPSISSKVIANNIYIEQGDFDKDFNASVSVNDIYIKKGNLSVTGNDLFNRFAKPFNARNIAIEKGDVLVNLWGNLIASSIVLDDGNFNSFASSCVQADTISSPNNSVALMNRADGIMNVSNYYAKSLFTVISHQVNKTPCQKETFVIEPTLPGEVITETRYRFDFKYNNDIVTKSPLIEVK
jgi:Tfp pilus assembly protein PilX